MSKFPGFYFDIGAKSRDVLYNGYAQQLPSCVQYRNLDCNLDLFLQAQEIVPGLTIYIRHIILDSTKVEVQYSRGYAGINAGLALVPNRLGGFNPVLSLSSLLGSSTISAGASTAFDIAKKEVVGYDAGVSFANAFDAVFLTLNDKLDTLRASYYHSINQLTDTRLAAELQHKFSVNETMLTVGFQYAPISSMLVKARANTDGGIAALIQQGFWQKLFLTISGETELSTKTKIPRIGLSLALKF